VDPTLGHGYWAYVPENYDPNVSHALVVWLQPKGDTLERTVAGKWQELCKERHLILLAPKAEDPSGWLTSEADTIKGYVREFLENYTIDRQRVVLHGLGNGAALAFYLAFDTRELVRGVAAVGGVLSGPVPENNAGQRLAFFLVGGAKDPDIEAIRGVPAKLREKKFPVAWRELPNEGHGYPPDAVIQELARWIDSLDRL
jgi:serine protease Do